MEIDWTYPTLSDDIYRIHKDGLQDILNNFNIKYSIEDTVIELRPVVASLKSFIKNHRTEEAREVFKTLVNDYKILEADTLETYPELVKIQEFITRRSHLYDTVATYESISPGKITQDYLTPIRKTEEARNNTHTPPTMAEHLPLISAGVYNGLPSENPNDFIDKYLIAAQSNRWTVQTQIHLFPAHLAGIALAWYKHYTKQRQIDSWEILKTSFIEAFTPVAQVHTLQIMLDNKIQETDQPALNYFLEIVTLCRRYEPNIEDKKIINYVIQGLRPEICELVLNETNDTLDQLQNNLRNVELKLRVQTQNREKYIRLTNKDRKEMQFQRTNYQESSKELNDLKTDIKTLTNIVANLNIQTTKPAQSNINNERNERSYGWIGRGRSPGERNPRRTTPVECTSQRWNDRGRSPRYRDSSATRGDIGVNQRQGWTFAGDRRVYQGQRRDQTPQRRPSHYQTEGWQPSRSVTFGANRWQGHEVTAPREFRADRRAPKFCHFCGRNNHWKWECKEKKKQEENQQRENKYCDNCKMTNHNTERCYRKHYVQKNA